MDPNNNNTEGRDHNAEYGRDPSRIISSARVRSPSNNMEGHEVCEIPRKSGLLILIICCRIERPNPNNNNNDKKGYNNNAENADELTLRWLELFKLINNTGAAKLNEASEAADELLLPLLIPTKRGLNSRRQVGTVRFSHNSTNIGRSILIIIRAIDLSSESRIIIIIRKYSSVAKKKKLGCDRLVIIWKGVKGATRRE